MWPCNVFVKTDILILRFCLFTYYCSILLNIKMVKTGMRKNKGLFYISVLQNDKENSRTCTDHQHREFY